MRRAVARALVVCGVAALPGDGRAPTQSEMELELMVVLASDEPGPIDARARKIHARLGREVRYQSLRVLDAKRERVGLDEVASIALPDGKRARVRPMAVDERGALLAVDNVDGALVGGASLTAKEFWGIIRTQV